MKFYNRTRIITGLALAAVGLTLSSTAFAASTDALSFTTGGNTYILQDNGSVVIGSNTYTDTSAVVGQINANIAVGTWTVVVTSTLTKPVTGSTTDPDMDLSWQVVGSGTGANALKISFTDTGFTGPTTGSFTATSGETLGSPTNFDFTTSYNSANAQFGGVTMTDSGILTGTTPSTITSSSMSLANPYGLTETLLISDSGASKISSGDAALSLSVPDGGATVALLGMAFIGLAGLRRKLCA